MYYELSFLTPEKVIFKGRVSSIIAPGDLGYLEILTDHAPILTTLGTGKVTITLENQEKQIYAVSEGFMRLLKNNASILVDSAELASEINPEQAKKALKKAEKLLRLESTEIDHARAKKALDRAKNRLKVYEDFTHPPENRQL